MGTNEEWLKKYEKKLTNSENNTKIKEPSEEIHKETDPISFINNNYFKWFLICCSYSIFKLFYESGGDLSRYYRPFEEFFIHFITILIFGLIPSSILKIFSKKEFSRVLIKTTLIIGILLIISSIYTDGQIKKRNQTHIINFQSEIHI